MQPVQDLTVEDRVSRTQFQYTLEDPSADELNVYAPKLLARLQQLPELRDVASDQQVLGLQTRLVFDRETASRLGITPSAIDQTLYDAYGQRQVSTMFTQLNQYHVVLEVKPDFHRQPARSARLFIRTGAAPGSGSAGVVAGGTGTAVSQRAHQFRDRVAGQPEFHRIQQRQRRGADRIHHGVSERRPGSAARVQHRSRLAARPSPSTIRASFRW